MQHNPDLLQPGSDPQGAPAVPALTVKTAPLSQHEAAQPVWFKSTMMNCSFHRKDGKKLPFVQGFFKATMQEDIDYLKSEIAQGNPYLGLASPNEVQQARSMEDPVGVMKEAMRDEIVNEFVGNLSLESLEKLMQEKRAVKTNQEQQAAQNAAAAAAEAAAKKTADLKATATKAAALAAEAKLKAAGGHASATGANTANLSAAVK